MRVAVNQMLITANIQDNFNKMMKFIEAANKNKCDLTVFPESCLTGYLGISLRSLNDLDIREIIVYLDKISKSAAEYGIAIVTGQYLKRCGNWYNNLICFDKTGKAVCSYDKAHLIDDDCYHITPGEAPSIFQLDNANFMLGVCHDIRYAEHAMWGAINGAKIYINPFYGFRNPSCSDKTQEIYNAMLATRAVENGMYIIAPNAANNEQMVRSQIRSPEGYSLAICDSYNEHILYCDINPDLAGKGWVLRRRSDLYSISVTTPNRESYFAKAYWQKQYYNINHNDSILNSDNIEELKFE